MILARPLGSAVVLCGLALAGCGGPAPSLPQPTTSTTASDTPDATTATASAVPGATPAAGAPGVAGAATPAPAAAGPATQAPGPAGSPANPARLPWPAATAAGAVSLQNSVDTGAQPWLLDPVQTAQSYADSLGWTAVQASGSGTAAPVRVTVHSSAGVHTLTLTQPERRGPGGIWLVTADSLR